jgi:biopolymer transport protein TolQ
MAAIGRSVPSLVLDAGLFAKFILLVLFIISVLSWAIIWDRTRLYLRLRSGGAAARRDLHTNGLRAVLSSIKQYHPSVEGSILSETARCLKTQPASAAGAGLSSENKTAHALRNSLDRRATEEISEMEKHLIFLATTAAVAPFLGLLGTVWGIMSSFLSMGVQGTASLEVVGPGIAEALVTTISGLATAIPALIGYNLLGRHLRRQEIRTDIFITRIIDSVDSVSGLRPASASEAADEKKSI